MTAKKEPAKRGPEAETLKIQSDWKNAIKKSLKKKKPAGGWPKEDSKVAK